MVKKFVRQSFILSITAAFLWACQIVLFRYQMIQGENPYTVALWSTGIEFPFWIWTLTRSKDEVKKLNPRIINIFVLIGFGSAIAIGLMENLALAYTTATNFAFLIRTVVLFTILLSTLFFKEPLTRKKILMTCTILAGAYFLNINQGYFTLQLGDIFTLMEAASIAFFTNILVKKMVMKLDPDFTAAATFMAGSIFLLIVLVIQKAPFLLHNIPLVFVYSLLGIAFARIRNRAFQHATSTFVTMIMSFTPVFTFILSFILLGEKLMPIQLFGGLLIVLTGLIAEFIRI